MTTTTELRPRRARRGHRGRRPRAARPPPTPTTPWSRSRTATTARRDPLVLRGRDAVRALLDDVAARKLEHRVQRAVADGRTGALQVRCRYPDGASVTCSSAFDLEDGRIVRETRLEVWDG